MISTKIIVDRIEEHLAVLVAADESGFQFELPLRLLPAGVQAGDHLRLQVAPDPASAQQTLQAISDLQVELAKEGDPQQTRFQL